MDAATVIDMAISAAPSLPAADTADIAPLTLAIPGALPNAAAPSDADDDMPTSLCGAVQHLRKRWERAYAVPETKMAAAAALGIEAAKLCTDLEDEWFRPDQSLSPGTVAKRLRLPCGARLARIQRTLLEMQDGVLHLQWLHHDLGLLVESSHNAEKLLRLRGLFASRVRTYMALERATAYIDMDTPLHHSVRHQTVAIVTLFNECVGALNPQQQLLLFVLHELSFRGHGRLNGGCAAEVVTPAAGTHERGRWCQPSAPSSWQ